MSNAKADQSLWTIGLLLFVAAQAGNWLITPMRHPDASDLRVAAVVAQGVLALGGAIWLIVRRRRARHAVAGAGAG